MRKNDLKDLIGILNDFLRNDANTYIWAKSQPGFLKDQYRFKETSYGIGGGNFFITLASLSLLSLLAKVYKILSNNNPLQLFNRAGRFKDETKAVEEFIKKLEEENIKIVNPVDEAKRFWSVLRHGLVHLFLPKSNSSVLAIDPIEFVNNLNLSYFKFKDYLIKAKSKAAIMKKEEGNGFYCDADLLAMRVQEAADWLLKKIDCYKINKAHKEAFDKLFD